MGMLRTLAVLLALTATANADPETSSKNRFVAAGLNWVLPGAGYAYNGRKPLYETVPMMAAAIGLTYAENFHKFDDGKTLLDHDKTEFGVLFGAVLVLNTALAIDAFREADAINAGSALTSWRLDVKRTRDAGGYAVVLGHAW
jgi:hypothetical protein